MGFMWVYGLMMLFFFVLIYGRAPSQVVLAPFCFGSGYTLQVLIRFAHCGLFAPIPHADMCAHMYVNMCVRHAEGCVASAIAPKRQRSP